MARDQDLLYSLRSARGRAAISIVEVGGAGCHGFVERFFRPASGGTLSLSTAAYGRLQGTRGEILDDVIVLAHPWRNSVLITVHGNPVIVRELIRWIREYGGVPAGVDGAWSNPADGLPCPIAEAALAALGQASTEEGVRFLLAQADQRPGARGLSAMLARWREKPPRLAELDDVLARSSAGLGLLRPARVVLTGPPNVGKSTLFNALLGRRRVVTDGAPGTTRDLIQETWVVDGFPLTLVDGAGLRDTEDEIEREGVDRMRSAIARADLVVLLGAAPKEAGHHLTLQIRPRADQILAGDRVETGDLFVSSVSGEGLVALAKAVILRLYGIGKPPEHEASPFTEEQVVALSRLRQELSEGGTGFTTIRRLSEESRRP